MLAAIALGVIQSPWGVAGGAIAGHLIATFVPILGGAFLPKYVMSVLHALDAIHARWWSSFQPQGESSMLHRFLPSQGYWSLFTWSRSVPRAALGGIYGVLNQKRGHVFEEIRGRYSII
ncbi:hypothetical protein IFM89_029550 [Coptis chinensis]|uniref:GDT1 family protein n=1 Tax=Coptis chinensis TaxID=261450 RepID=A0A835GYS1_9MAGN|nr:hypothetical protein IFM89_029550 [Coptis chinensis]